MKIYVKELRNKSYVDISGDDIKPASKCEVVASVHFDSEAYFSGEFTFKQKDNVKGFSSAERAIRRLFSGEEAE